MLCQKCGLTEASIHREQMVYRQKIEEHLCALCAGVGQWTPQPGAPSGPVLADGVTIRAFAETSGPWIGGRGSTTLQDIGGHLGRLCAAGIKAGHLTISAADRFQISIFRPGSAPLVLAISLYGADRERRTVVLSVEDFFRQNNVPVYDSDHTPRLCYQLPGPLTSDLPLLLGLLTECLEVQPGDPLRVGIRLRHGGRGSLESV